MALNRNYILLMITGGLILGLLLTFSPGSLFCLLVVLLIILALYLFASKEERPFLINIFVLGILIRVFLLLSITFLYSFIGKWIYFSGNMKAIAFIGDSAFYTVRGWWLTQFYSGQPLSRLIAHAAFNEYGFSGHLHIIALFYYLFGFSPVSFTLTNCIFSVSTGIIFYFLTKEVSGIKEAKIVCLLITFFPSLIIWSVSNLKDSMFIFLTAVILWSFLRLIQFKKIRYLILFLFSIFLQFSIRKIFLIPTFLAAMFSYLFIKKRYKYIFFAILIIMLISPMFNIQDKFKIHFVSHNRGVISTRGVTYRVFDDYVYDRKFSNYTSISNFNIAKAFLKNGFHFFLEPFPWRVSLRLSIFALPQMMIWYFLLPFSVIGMILQLRYNREKSLVLIAYFLITGSLLVMAGGNIGTDFRFRDILTPIVILFAIIGICNTFCPRQNSEHE
ncbi:MAG: glycosyltransferase family 39 protein [Candidatus Omnitrophota bacterium]